MKFLEKLIRKLAGMEPSARGQPENMREYPMPQGKAEKATPSGTSAEKSRVETRRAPRSALSEVPCASRLRCKYKDSVDRCRYKGQCIWKNAQKGG